MSRIRRSIEQCGFQAGDAEVRISGTVIEGEDGELVLSVARPEMVYLLRDHPDAIGKVAELEKAGTGKKVYVHGHMDGKTPSQKQTQSSLVLRLRTFLIKTVLLAGTCLKRNRLGQSSLLIATLLSMTRVRLSHQSPNRRVAVRFNDTPGWLEKPRVETYLSGLEVGATATIR